MLEANPTSNHPNFSLLFPPRPLRFQKRKSKIQKAKVVSDFEVMTVNMAASACQRCGRWEWASYILTRTSEKRPAVFFHWWFVYMFTVDMQGEYGIVHVITGPRFGISCCEASIKFTPYFFQI